MSHTAKNIIIVILLIVIGFLFYALFDLSYGRYCTPIIREFKPPPKSEMQQSETKDSLKQKESSPFSKKNPDKK